MGTKNVFLELLLRRKENRVEEVSATPRACFSSSASEPCLSVSENRADKKQLKVK